MPAPLCPGEPSPALQVVSWQLHLPHADIWNGEAETRIDRGNVTEEKGAQLGLGLGS